MRITLDHSQAFQLLSTAIQEGDKESFFRYKPLVDDRVYYMKWGKRGRTLLHLAAAASERTFVEALIRKNWWIRAQYGNQCFPVHLAAAHGSRKSLNLLLAKDPKLFYAKDKIGNLPIHYGVLKKGSTAFLLSQASEIPLNKLGRTPLHHAAVLYQTGQMPERYLLPLVFFMYVDRFGESILSMRDEFGHTPLEVFSRKSQISKKAWKATRRHLEKAIDLALRQPRLSYKEAEKRIKEFTF